MKIGLVKHLNARPLTYGFEKKGNFSVRFENPSVLKEELLKGELEAALISSVECLRNADKLNFSTKVGVCSAEEVRSILYFENKQEKYSDKIYTDSGSRSSVALLQILLKEKYGQVPTVVPTPANEILKMIEKGEGYHLLFGDHALLAKWNREFYASLDLASWWFEQKKLSFIFALWAYPKNIQLDESIFLESLEYGLKNLEEIIQLEIRLPESTLRKYLKEELHYIVTERDKKGFELFAELCYKYSIL
jgi:chorismate dehydratase